MALRTSYIPPPSSLSSDMPVEEFDKTPPKASVGTGVLREKRVNSAPLAIGEGNPPRAAGATAASSSPEATLPQANSYHHDGGEEDDGGEKS